MISSRRLTQTKWLPKERRQPPGHLQRLAGSIGRIYPRTASLKDPTTMAFFFLFPFRGNTPAPSIPSLQEHQMGTGRPTPLIPGMHRVSTLGDATCPIIPDPWKAPPARLLLGTGRKCQKIAPCSPRWQSEK